MNALRHEKHCVTFSHDPLGTSASQCVVGNQPTTGKLERMGIVTTLVTCGTGAEVKNKRGFWMSSIRCVIRRQELLKFQEPLTHHHLTLVSVGKACPVGIVLPAIHQMLSGNSNT